MSALEVDNSILYGMRTLLPTRPRPVFYINNIQFFHTGHHVHNSDSNFQFNFEFYFEILIFEH